MSADLPDDLTGVALQESATNNRNLIFESRANGQHVHNLSRTTAAIKNSKTSPLEAAANDIIVGKSQGTNA